MPDAAPQPPRSPRRVRRRLLLAPSLLLGAAGALVVAWRGDGLEPAVPALAGPLGALATALATAALLWGGAWALERVSPSFRYAQRRLEGALRGLRPSPALALALALATGAGEELVFRGALMPWLGGLAEAAGAIGPARPAGPGGPGAAAWAGNVGQALLFAALHPAGRRGWAYTAYTGAAGLLLGAAAILTGGLAAGILAHAAINLQGFLEVGRRSRGEAPPRAARRRRS